MIKIKHSLFPGRIRWQYSERLKKKVIYFQRYNYLRSNLSSTYLRLKGDFTDVQRLMHIKG